MSDIDIKIDNKQVDKEELASYLRQKENLKILGFIKFHLWLYNISNKDKEESLLRNIGEPPVIYDPGLHLKSKEQINQYLYNKGYYQAKLTDEVEFKKKRAFIKFNIETGEPYKIRNIKHSISDPDLKGYIKENLHESLIKEGEILDVDIMDKERTRIRRLLNDKGYFKFVEDYIHFKIDSTLTNKMADVEMVVENPGNVSDSLYDTAHKIYNIKDYEISIYNSNNTSSSTNFRDYGDTLTTDNYTFFYNKKLPIDKKVILKTIESFPGDIYTKAGEERLYNNLFSLRQFKYVNIQFQEDPRYRDSIRGLLTGRIFLPMQVKQNYSLDIEGTNTSGNLGIAGNLNYQHRNLFGGAQIFDIKLRGATERQVFTSGGNSSKYNMNEIGGEAKLSFPGFLFPVDEHKLKLFSMPFTYFSMAYNYQDRQNYTRTIVNATFGYQWKSSSEVSHFLNLIDLNAVRIFRFDSTFFNSIQDLYIKYSYTNHVVSATNYSFIYNNQDLKKRSDYNYLRLNLETVGNSLWIISSIFGFDKFSYEDSKTGMVSDYYKIFDTRFAQYLKGDIEYRYGYRFDKYNSFASRAFLGIAFPYGNFDVIPFEKMYFTGGANGVRAWQVRSLGPGSYVPGENEYPNQSSDIKMEANIEYRFNIIWNLEGALFVDAGNIWAMNNTDNREGAVFKFNKFYNEFAVGTGFGLRLVTNYFVIRTDLGVKLRDPSMPDGKRWIPGNRPYGSSDFNINIGIGYPF